jgi:ribosomal protein S18 acetylase RimI-like enzyme
MVVTIRACAPGDERALALVGKATFLETYAGTLERADVLDHCDVEHGEPRYAAWLKTPDYRLWLAEVEGGAPVGYAVLGPSDLPIPTTVQDLELKRIYLLHRFEGMGVGRRLMETAVEAAMTAGARRLLLGVYDENHRALAFYARQGFTEAGRKAFIIGSTTYDDLVLGRPLQTGPKARAG